jgi:GR25 family glycosyltransferase involved in LPS biosynthesis
VGFRGLFINLDRKPERRRRMEAEFSRFKLSQFYQRLSAVDGHPGETGVKAGAIGCFRSHLKAIGVATTLGPIVHILEDDRILSGRLRPFLNSPACATALRQYDIVFLEMWVDPNVQERYRQAYRQAGAGVTLLDLRGLRIGSTASYVVSGQSAGRIGPLLVAEVGRGPRMPIDNYYSRLVDTGQLRAAVVVPFVTCIDFETGVDSSIQYVPRDQLIDHAMRRASFFVDRARYSHLEAADRARNPRQSEER